MSVVLEPDCLEILRLMRTRMEAGQQEYGRMDVRNYTDHVDDEETEEELVDAVVYQLRKLVRRRMKQYDRSAAEKNVINCARDVIKSYNKADDPLDAEHDINMMALALEALKR